MSCSCGCSPCCCPTAGETDVSECVDPGIIKLGSYASVLNDDMCSRRLTPYRGLKDDGTPNTNSSDPLQPAVMAQDSDGNVRWTAAPCNKPPEQVARVANDDQAADPTNYIKTLVGKTADGCDVRLKGSSDTSSGQWKLVWVASTQSWTSVPDTGEGGTTSDICTTVAAGFSVAPGTEEYVIEVASSEHMAVGVSAKVRGYEFVVTEIISDTYIRAELLTTITSPGNIFIGDSICNIGFRPCPRSSAPYSDNIVACLSGNAVAVELPDDVNDIPVPGLYWRNQLGRVAFLPVPVDPVTGLQEPGYVLKTTTTPVAGGANLPGWEQASSGYTWISPVVVFSQSGTGPTWGTFTYDTDLIAAKPSNAKMAILDVKVEAITTSSYYTALILINNLTAAMAAVHAGFATDCDTTQLIVPIELTSILTMAISRTRGSSSGNNSWELEVKVVGFIS